MSEEVDIRRPCTLAEVADWATDLAMFGRNLRDWQHEVRRRPIGTRVAFQASLFPTPPLLSVRFNDGEVADAYLAAYAEWLADRAGIARPEWTRDPARVSSEPWFSTPLRGRLLATTPASFRQRNLFAIPEPVFTPRRGRPPVSASQKREKARLRQKAYRRRQSAKNRDDSSSL